MKISEALVEAKNLLKDIQSSSFVSMSLMMFCLKQTKEWIFLNSDKNFEDEERFFKFIYEFKSGTPLEYIIGKVSFYSMEFEIFSGVLIPRPETEILIDKVLDIVDKNFKDKMVNIAEIGFGSGIISTTLALNIKNSNIISTDINQIAFENAKKNINKFGVANKIKLLQSSYLDGVDLDIDILVSNPPYIANNYALDKWVLNEPKNALFGGEVGDEMLKEIISIAYKRKIKFLACEIGYDQKISLSNELKRFGYQYEFYEDLAGLDRGFIAYFV